MGKFYEVTLNNWNDIHEIANNLRCFAFRGQADSNWDLETSIERAFNKYNLEFPLYSNKEHWILNEFKEKFHLYSNHPPSFDNNFEWSSLLQHHGCPTRLLDFSESIYTAAFFALEESSYEMSSIWAINKNTLRDNIYEILKLPYLKGKVRKDVVNKVYIDSINQYIANINTEKEEHYAVIPIHSIKKSHRLSRQQGLFLVPIKLCGYIKEKNFMKNLAYSFNSTEINFESQKLNIIDESCNENVDLIKINIPKNLYKHGLKNLVKMNITAETLFPDLDGLSKSLTQTIIRNN